MKTKCAIVSCIGMSNSPDIYVHTCIFSQRDIQTNCPQISSDGYPPSLIPLGTIRFVRKCVGHMEAQY